MLAPSWSRCCFSLALALALAVVACGPKGADGDGVASLGDTDGDGDTVGGETDDTDDTDDTDWIVPNRDVDVLFVIDNSGTMGEEQAALATSADALIAALEAADANYRIGITTSDNGNPYCTDTTTPEAGRLVMSSCKTRIDDFIFNNGQADLDFADLVCNDICTLSEAELEILPTTTDVDANATPRPWVQRIEGQTNLPPGTDVTQAVHCFLPQGITGCGFESQLESMYLALTRTQLADEPSYGFHRTSAVLAVVLVSDEADCSSNESFAEIFEQDGNRVFWSDPAAEFPTSAVCWNAGVTCTGDPSNYASCDPVNKDVNGNEGVAEEDAVLYPTSRYLRLLDALEQEQHALNPNREIIVALIGGVQSAGGTPFYADVTNTDPEFQDRFGIGPGCQAVDPNNPDEPALAVPPVRMRDVSDAVSPGNLYSICDADYSATMVAVAQQIVSQF